MGPRLHERFLPAPLAETPVMPTELIYRVLSDTRRRYAFHYLKQQRGEVSVRELAEQVAAWENDKPPAQLSSQERKRVYISLYQSHLPTLDKQGIVAYDTPRGMVSLPEEIRGLDIYLEVVPRWDLRWSTYYLLLGILNALILVLAYLEFPLFDSVPDLAWGGFVLLTFLVSAAAQAYYSERMRFGDPGPPPELQATNGDQRTRDD